MAPSVKSPKPKAPTSPKATTTKTKTTSGAAQRNTDLKNGGQSVTTGQTNVTETETREEYSQRAPSSPKKASPAPSSGGGGSPGRMSDQAGHRLLATAWMTGIGIISWQEIKNSHQMPVPKRFVGWSVAIGILDVLGPIISFELAGVLAVGLAIGLFIKRGNPTNVTTTPDAKAATPSG